MILIDYDVQTISKFCLHHLRRVKEFKVKISI